MLSLNASNVDNLETEQDLVSVRARPCLKCQNDSFHCVDGFGHDILSRLSQGGFGFVISN